MYEDLAFPRMIYFKSKPWDPSDEPETMVCQIVKTKEELIALGDDVSLTVIYGGYKPETITPWGDDEFQKIIGDEIDKQIAEAEEEENEAKAPVEITAVEVIEEPTALANSALRGKVKKVSNGKNRS